MRCPSHWLGTDSSGGNICSGACNSIENLVTRTVAKVPELLIYDCCGGPVVVIFPEPGILLTDLGMCQVSR